MVCLERCAVRSQDFAIFHREYIGFENPYQIRIRIRIRLLTALNKAQSLQFREVATEPQEY